MFARFDWCWERSCRVSLDPRIFAFLSRWRRPGLESGGLPRDRFRGCPGGNAKIRPRESAHGRRGRERDDRAQHADLRLSELARSAIVVKKANRELHVEANDCARTLVRPRVTFTRGRKAGRFESRQSLASCSAPRVSLVSYAARSVFRRDCHSEQLARPFRT